MIEPTYKVGFLARLLDVAPGSIRTLIERGDFGPFEVGGARGDFRVPLSGVAHFFAEHASRGRLAMEPHLSSVWLAELTGEPARAVRASIEAGEWGPDFVRIPTGPGLRVPLAGVHARLQSRRIEPRRAAG